MTTFFEIAVCVCVCVCVCLFVCLPSMVFSYVRRHDNLSTYAIGSLLLLAFVFLRRPVLSISLLFVIVNHVVPKCKSIGGNIGFAQ